MKKNFLVYKITNKINKNIYIGTHITFNVNDSYMGSGTNIGKAIKAEGIENFEKIILYNFNNKEDMMKKERELVNREFIKRNDTYNIILGGGNTIWNDTVCVKDKEGNNIQVHITDPRYISGELLHIAKGKTTVKDKEGNNLYIDINDPRYLSGELVGVMKNMVLAKDKEENYIMISKSDPRYLSGEFIHFWKNRNHSETTKLKIKNTCGPNHQQKEKNSQYGTCWIRNEIENKKIKKEELEKYLKEGWIKGRKIKNG